MPDISSIGHGPIGPVDRSAPARSATRSRGDNGLPEVTRPGSDARESRDRVELSEHARILDRIRSLPEGRLDRVESVREQIADGSYETEDKLSAAVNRMLEDLEID